MPANVWPNISESPWVEAVYAVLQEMPELAGYDDPLDVRRFVHPATMPIGNLRRQLDDMQVPSTDFFGDDFTRRVGVNLYEYFEGRDRWSGVDRTAEDLMFEYIPTWKTSGGRRVGVDFCITPSPTVMPTTDYVAAVKDWLDWVLPHFEGDIPASNPPEPAIEVTLCDFAQAPFSLQVAATAVITRIVAAR